MKKRVFLVATVLFTMGASSLSQSAVSYLKGEDSTMNQPIKSVIDDLIDQGYSAEMIHDLFGADNRYFPVDSDKLESVMFMIDMLIEEGKYQDSQKTVMIFLAFDAHRLAQGESITDTAVLSAK